MQKESIDVDDCLLLDDDCVNDNCFFSNHKKKKFTVFAKGFFSAFIVGIFISIGAMTLSPDVARAKKIENNLENTLYLDLKDGRVVIRMLPDIAPKHVARIKELVRSGFYDGLTFHRVIKDFMAQGGDPLGNGTGGSGQKIPAEFSMKYTHKRGAVSMARSQDVNSADSQFFIVLADSSYLDGLYTIWGYVIDGMEYVDNIKKGDTIMDGVVSNPDKIVKMSIAIDVDGKRRG